MNRNNIMDIALLWLHSIMNSENFLSPGDQCIWALRMLQPSGNQSGSCQCCPQTYEVDTQGGGPAFYTNSPDILTTVAHSIWPVYMEFHHHPSDYPKEPPHLSLFVWKICLIDMTGEEEELNLLIAELSICFEDSWTSETQTLWPLTVTRKVWVSLNKGWAGLECHRHCVVTSKRGLNPRTNVHITTLLSLYGPNWALWLSEGVLHFCCFPKFYRLFGD